MQPSMHTNGIQRISTNCAVAASRAGAADADPLGQSMHLMGAMMAYPRNNEIFGENEPADYLYKVVSGSVRTYKILSDGRRQVGGFYRPRICRRAYFVSGSYQRLQSAGGQA